MSSNLTSKKEDGAKKAKIECSYGDGCYRKNPQHFQEYTHSHLNDLLRGMGDMIVIPSHYKPKISYKTLIEQLGYVRNLNGGRNLPKHENEPMSSNQSTSKGTASVQPSNCSSSSKRASQSEQDGPIKGQQNPAWNAAMENYRFAALSKMKLPLREKMEAASPYNVFLTTIKDSKETHNEPLSISFPELLDSYFGELECSLQINFMVEFGFLIAQYHICGYKSKPLTLLYGQVDCDLKKFGHFLTHALIKPPSSFGSHHTKMMIFHYTNKTVRIVVSTANLVESDWENRTQGLWISPACPFLPEGSDTGAGESVTNFKQDLLQYLTAYDQPCMQPWLETLRKVDMSGIKVFFIASVPGSHAGTKSDMWGHLKLAKLLKKNVPPNNGQVIAQCSSIGSLGPKPNSWLQGEILSTLRSCKSGGSLGSIQELKLVYPTFNSIKNSYDDLLGGGCLPYPKATHKKQLWLNQYLCDWYSNKRHRTRAPPHIKSYTRVSQDLQKIYYFVLTSANMSKAAWGQKAKSGSLNILSYEAGILLVPQIMISEDYFPLTEEKDGINPFSLPYDLPVVPYTNSDVPWFIDILSG